VYIGTHLETIKFNEHEKLLVTGNLLPVCYR